MTNSNTKATPEYRPHRIGSHSDDRGGDSDLPCDCDRPTHTSAPSDSSIYGILARFFDVARNERNWTPSKQSIAAAEAVAAIKDLLIKSQIDSLGNVQLDYGHQQAQIWVDGKLIPLLDHLTYLESQLSKEKK